MDLPANCSVYYYDKNKTDLCSFEEREKGKFYYFDGQCYTVDEIPLNKWNENYQRCTEYNNIILPKNIPCSVLAGRSSNCYNKLTALYGSNYTVDECSFDCRLEEECPDKYYRIGCPIGYFVCGNRCIDVHKGKCEIESCKEGEIMCPTDFSCVTNIEQCPTKVNTNPGFYVCMDGQQKEDPFLCSAPPRCKAGEYLCDNNQCMARREDCPKKKVCPMGYALCPNFKCQITCDPTQDVCPSQVS